MDSQNKQRKMQGYINYRMRATMKDGRQIVGQMLAFDKHMNLVLAEAEEFRKVKRKNKVSTSNSNGTIVEQEEKRSLGLAIIRGANVVACSVDGPPPADPALRVGGTSSAPLGSGPAVVHAGPGIARPAGRGAGLQGPALGVGGPGFPGGPPPGMGGFPGGPSPGMPPFGRGGPPGAFPPQGFPGAPPGAFPPAGFQGPPGGRGYPPPPGGYQGR